MKKFDKVIFYDASQARQDKDYSGKDPKHWPTGTIIDIYRYPGRKDMVADIMRADGTISKAHFLTGLKLV